MALKGKLEAIIYAAEDPVTLDQLTLLLKESVIHEENLTEMEPATAQTEARSRIRAALEALMADYNHSDRGMEVREVAGGYRMATKPEHHDLIRGFAKSMKPPIKLSLQALETLSVIAYKQPITAPEIAEIRGVDASGVLANLIEKKLVTTAGRKQVIGRPILYKTTKEFLLRFGLKDISELPSMEEFEKMLSGGTQEDLFALAESPSAPAAENSAERTSEFDTAEQTKHDLETQEKQEADQINERGESPDAQQQADETPVHSEHGS
jgi:segregation and condensation protein B